MGIAAAFGWTVALLAIGATVASFAERAMNRWVPATEPGPAARVRVALARRPSRTDPWLYGAGPPVALFGVALALVVIPFGKGLVGADLEIGVFYYLVVLDFVSLAVALGGWGANTQHAVEACYRAVAQLTAYVVPLGLAVIGPLMMARTLRTVAIVEAQRNAGLWYVVVQPLGFALYVVTAAMQSYRSPFAEPFASTINGGVLAAYGGAQALAWRIALSALLFTVSAMGAVLFLGGYASPLGGPLGMLVKTLFVLTLLLLVGHRVRPRSTSAMLALSWKLLVPIGLLNVGIVGVLILLGVGQSAFR
jgi:NADH-quinone oxidoreductase subunit H